MLQPRQARVNHQLFTQAIFDSGSLGVMASVIHQFPAPGDYQAVVRQNGNDVGSFSFKVEDASPIKQLNIDLAAFPENQPRRRPADTGDCHCPQTSPADPASQPPRVVAPDGYVLFYVSSGPGGYAVRAAPAQAKDPQFDSEQLANGDLFALSLLEPTTYSMTDRLGGAQGQITVTFSRDDAARIRTIDPVYVDANGKSFDPSQVRLIAAQGLIFRIRQRSRIVVEKQGHAKDPTPPEAPVARWQKPRTPPQAGR